MSKVRVCPKCGKIENQFTYFCTECGWQTESQEIETDYRAVKPTEKSELHIDEKATSIDKNLISQETKMADIIMENQSAKREDASESSDWSVGSYKALRSQEISRPEPVGFVEDDSDEFYIDLKCPHCQERLSYMNWQVQESLVCPMCNTNFRYDESIKSTKILDDYISEPEEQFICDTTELETDYFISEKRRFTTTGEYHTNVDGDEIDDIELDGTFVDIICPHCNSELSFYDWQIEAGELTCPMCENHFTANSTTTG